MRRVIKFAAVPALGLAIVGIWALMATAAPAKLVAQMNGEKEVSPEGDRGVGDEDGTGRAVVRVFPGQGRLCFNVGWNNIGAPSMAHVHEGDRNTAGPVVVLLWNTGDEAAEGDQDLPATVSGVRGCAEEVEQDLLRRIKRNPKEFYVNVHNDDFPGGAIRGQLRRRR